VRIVALFQAATSSVEEITYLGIALMASANAPSRADQAADSTW
jgi:hypothetical protein